MQNTYVTLTFEEFDLQRLPEEQRIILKDLFKRYKQNPGYGEFTNYYMDLCKPVFAKMPKKRITDSPLYNIAEDLAMRLGIEHGEMREPDYRDMLEHIIMREYNSIADFCKDSGEDRSYLSHLFAKNKNASIDRLAKILDKLGYQLSFRKKQESQLV